MLPFARSIWKGPNKTSGEPSGGAQNTSRRCSDSLLMVLSFSLSSDPQNLIQIGEL
jgi:hypothetical protein